VAFMILMWTFECKNNKTKVYFKMRVAGMMNLNIECLNLSQALERMWNTLLASHHKIHVVIKFMVPSVEIITYLFCPNEPFAVLMGVCGNFLNKINFHFSHFYFQIKHRFGLYDEITFANGKRTRHCNWIRFLKTVDSYGPQVNHRTNFYVKN
jgi:hypothetical protein